MSTPSVVTETRDGLQGHPRFGEILLRDPWSETPTKIVSDTTPSPSPPVLPRGPTTSFSTVPPLLDLPGTPGDERPPFVKCDLTYALLVKT